MKSEVPNMEINGLYTMKKQFHGENQNKKEETSHANQKIEEVLNLDSFENAQKQYIEKCGIPLISINYKPIFHISIETQRLLLESMVEDDGYLLYKYLWCQPNIMKLFASGSTKNLEETQKKVSVWARRWKNQNPFAGMNIRVKTTKQYLGYIVMGFGEERNSSEVAYAIRQSQWNKGYGYESIGATVLFLSTILRKNGFKVNNSQQFKRIIATSSILNLGSMKILEKLGFSVYKMSEKFGGKRMHYELKLI